MSRIIKTSEKIILDSPEIDFITPLIKLNTAPTVNNANIQYLTRNSGTGNLEVVNTLPTIYNANGTLTGDRTVSGGASNNLTFSGGLGTFTVGIWSNIVINGITTTFNSSSSTSMGSTNVLFLGTTTPTTNLSGATRTLNIDSSTTKLSNVSFRPGGLLAGQYLFVDAVSKNLRCENLPIAYGAAQIIANGVGPVLTSVVPVDVSGPDLSANSIAGYNFQTTINDGLQYNISVNSTTFPVTTFKIELSGYYTASVAQDYSVGILVNGVLVSQSVKNLTYTGTNYADISTRPFIFNLSNGDEVKVALGRQTTDATFTINANLMITPISYF